MEEKEEGEEEDEVSFAPLSSPVLERSLYEPYFAEEKMSCPGKS